ncbi:low choriolytic enzyme-like [Stylophora pistillata]|uniref:low choriolytic enzyme-like n=1 Tax=Stylophora pistillata TaxID=50429 RepID=UPI000C04427E|nr:low choriolytic enzyme-like [Stylophora pistillata]
MRVDRVQTALTSLLVFLHLLQLHGKAVNGSEFVIIEGDMMVDKGFVEHYMRRRKKRGAILNRRVGANYYWPGTTVDGDRIVRIPYTLDVGFFGRLFGNDMVKGFLAAVQEFAKRTCLRFEEKEDEDKDYLEIFSGPGCFSMIGRRGGKQEISLGKGCETKGKAIHELMHAIGFLHEQSRKDRDQHVTILAGNILDVGKSEFKTYNQDNSNLPYDFHSIMHYNNKIFSKNGEDTIRALIDPEMTLGQEYGLSALDVVRVNMLYKCPQLRKDLVLYFVIVYTSGDYWAGTDSRVDILLDGAEGDSGEIELESPEDVPNPFERGSKDTFPVIAPAVGELKKIRIRLAGSSWSWFNGWKLERVKIETPDNKKIHFKYNEWIYSGDHVTLSPSTRRKRK